MALPGRSRWLEASQFSHTSAFPGDGHHTLGRCRSPSVPFHHSEHRKACTQLLRFNVINFTASSKDILQWNWQKKKECLVVTNTLTTSVVRCDSLPSFMLSSPLRSNTTTSWAVWLRTYLFNATVPRFPCLQNGDIVLPLPHRFPATNAESKMFKCHAQCRDTI